MRSARGYLDDLIRSANPVAGTAVPPTPLPDWGPSPLPSLTDATRVPAIETPGPPTPTIATRPMSPRPTPRPPGFPATPPDAAPDASRRSPKLGPRPLPVEVVSRPTPAFGTALSARDSQKQNSGVVPRLETDTEAAVQRLEHLTRQFAPDIPRPTHDEATDQPAPRESAPPRPAPAVTLVREHAPEPLLVQPAPPEVQIGSIEVFVTPAPPVAASVIPLTLAAAPARLSRPLAVYGFGQG